MNALEIFANQIETFGTPTDEHSYGGLHVKYYSIDTVTMAVIYYNDSGKPLRATFYN